MGTSSSTQKIVKMQSTSQWRAKLEASKQSNKLLVVDFTASWCGPCKIMEPTIEDYANRYRDVEFVKIDVDILADVAQEFKVDTMPTYVFVKKGKEVGRVVGARKEELLRMIETHKIGN